MQRTKYRDTYCIETGTTSARPCNQLRLQRQRCAASPYRLYTLTACILSRRTGPKPHLRYDRNAFLSHAVDYLHFQPTSSASRCHHPSAYRCRWKQSRDGFLLRERLKLQFQFRKDGVRCCRLPGLSTETVENQVAQSPREHVHAPMPSAGQLGITWCTRSSQKEWHAECGRHGDIRIAHRLSGAFALSSGPIPSYHRTEGASEV